jgi:L-rhamnose isomerase
MTLKEELLVIVRAFNALITNQSNADALKQAQDELAALKASETLTEAESAEVDAALANAAAVTPPAPEQVEAVTTD